MKITRAGSQASAKGPADWFTCMVRLDPLFDATVEAVEEAVIDSIIVNETMVGRDGHRSIALPQDENAVAVANGR